MYSFTGKNNKTKNCCTTSPHLGGTPRVGSQCKATSETHHTHMKLYYELDRSKKYRRLSATTAYLNTTSRYSVLCIRCTSPFQKEIITGNQSHSIITHENDDKHFFLFHTPVLLSWDTSAESSEALSSWRLLVVFEVWRLPCKLARRHNCSPWGCRATRQLFGRGSNIRNLGY